MHVPAPALQLRDFPALELPLEGDNVRALAREPVHAVSEAMLLDDLAAELHDPGHEAAGLLQVSKNAATRLRNGCYFGAT